MTNNTNLTAQQAITKAKKYSTSAHVVARLLTEPQRYRDQSQYNQFVEGLFNTPYQRFFGFRSSVWHSYSNNFKRQVIASLLNPQSLGANQADRAALNAMVKRIGFVEPEIVRQVINSHQLEYLKNGVGRHQSLYPVTLPQQALTSGQNFDKKKLNHLTNQQGIDQLMVDFERIPELTIMHKGQLVFQGSPSARYKSWLTNQYKEQQLAEQKEKTENKQAFLDELLGYRTEIKQAILRTYGQHVTPALSSAVHRYYMESQEGLVDNPYTFQQVAGQRALTINVDSANKVRYDQSRQLKLKQDKDNQRGIVVRECGTATYDLANGYYSGSACLLADSERNAKAAAEVFNSPGSQTGRVMTAQAELPAELTPDDDETPTAQPSSKYSPNSGQQ